MKFSKLPVIFLVLAAGLIMLMALRLGKYHTDTVSPKILSSIPVLPKVVQNRSLNKFNPTPISLKTIFGEDHKWTATLSAQLITTMMATGDIVPARKVNYLMTTKKDFLWPYTFTAETVKNADITVINLEAPMFDSCKPTETGMTFCSNPRSVEGLISIGTDIANLANNHMGNYGIEMVNNTTKILKENGIETIGTGNTLYKEVKGIRFAFLGYNDVGVQTGVTNASEAAIQKDLELARPKADVIVIAVHWGTEYVSQPDPAQVKLAHFMIDHGADLIIGNHPHWIKPVEIYKNKLIAYAHGNFVFDQMWSEETKEGVIGKYTFLGKQLIDVQYTPIKIRDWGQNYFPDESESKRIIDKMATESSILETDMLRGKYLSD